MAMTGNVITETGDSYRKVLLVYTNYSSFVQADHEMLASFSEVSLYHYRPVKGAFSTLRELLRQLLFLITRRKRYDLILIWFADTHAYLPVSFGRWCKIKTAVVIGGFDAVSFPHLKYGLFCSNPVRQYFGKYVLRNANYLLPVDASLVENLNIYADVTGKGIRQGIKTFVSGIRGRIIPTPTGYDPERWKNNPAVPRKNSVVTVGSVNSGLRWVLKGGDFLALVAREMPDTEFHIYGVSEKMIQDLKQEEMPENLSLHGFTLSGDLPDIYSRHAVYAQFSLSEGLPNALCEAMLCGCIPVGSHVNGIPEAIGDTRLITGKKEVQEAVCVIRAAQAISLIRTDRYRNRIMGLFPQERRKGVFRELLNLP